MVRQSAPKAAITFVAPLLFLFLLANTVLAGTDVKVNQDVGIDLQNEISLVANPANPSNLVAIYNDDPDNSGGFTTGPGLGVGYSTNSGTTWNTTHTPSVFGHEFDPGITADLSGYVYAGHISQTYSYPKANTGVFVARSSDGGVNWTQPTTVEAFSGNGVTFVPYVDKTLMASDNYAGSQYKDRTYIVWQRDATDWVHSEVYISSSTDRGVTWATPVKINDQPTSAALSNAAAVAVTPDGTVCVAWLETNQPQPNPIPADIMFDKSTDGGATFSQDTTVASFTKTYKFPNSPPYSSFRANSFPSIATDPTNSGNVYVVFTGDPDGTFGPDDGDIMFSGSTDGGQSWSAAKKVNDDAGMTGQFSPWIAVSSNGTAYVVWYDRRSDPMDIDLDVYYTSSGNGGQTFSVNQKTNDVVISLKATPDAGPLPSNSWLGEYLGLAPHSSGFYVAWTDKRNGEKDIYFDSIITGGGTADLTPPVTTATTVPAGPDGDGGWYVTAPQIGLVADETATTYYQWDSVDPTAWLTYTAALYAADGTRTLSYYSMDTAGNTENVSSRSFMTDTGLPTDPTLSSSSHVIGTWSADNTVDISITGASDSISGVDGFSAWWTQGATSAPDAIKDMEETVDSTTSPPLADGIWYFSLRTKDNARNWTATEYLGPFNVDVSRPQPPVFVFNPPPAGYNHVTVSWTNPADLDFDVTRILQSQVGYASTATTTANQTVIYQDPGTSWDDTGLAGGAQYWYTVFSRDLAGNWSDPATATVTTQPAPTVLTAGANPSIAHYRQRVVLYGALRTYGNTPLNPQNNVVAYRSTNGGVSWTKDATAWSTTPGRYETWALCTVNTWFQLRYGGQGITHAGSTSPRVLVRTYACLSTPYLSPTAPWANRYFTVYGFLNPRHAGKTLLRFDRYRNGRYVHYTDRYARNYNYSGSGTFKGGTKFQLRTRLRAGKYRVRALHKDSNHATSWSKPRYFRVR